MAVADDIAVAFKAATKDLYAEKKRRERDARRADRPVRQPVDRITLRDAVFDVLPVAIAATSGNGAYQFPTRNLFYAVRPRIQDLTDAELKYNYFSQTLVVEYEQERGRIPGMYREPRGTLHEPHTDTTVPLGTLEVGAYTLPEYVFDKILYVEKEGLTPIFESARLAERFDLAIAAGKGQPVEAIRALFERAEAGDYRLFVLHDADPSGYSIARTISEETKRMPDYRVDVVDLGLTVGDALERRLATEKFTRRKDLPWWMPDRLDERERAWFQGRLLTPPWESKRQWECTRVELNAFTAPDLIAYIEAGLEAHDATDKIVPPGEVLADQARATHRDAIKAHVEDYLARRFDADTLIHTLIEAFPLDADADLGQVVTDAHAADRATWWKTAIGDDVKTQVADLDDDLNAKLDDELSRLLDPGGDR